MVLATSFHAVLFAPLVEVSSSQPMQARLSHFPAWRPWPRLFFGSSERAERVPESSLVCPFTKGLISWSLMSKFMRIPIASRIFAPLCLMGFGRFQAKAKMRMGRPDQGWFFTEFRGMRPKEVHSGLRTASNGLVCVLYCWMTTAAPFYKSPTTAASSGSNHNKTTMTGTKRASYPRALVHDRYV